MTPRLTLIAIFDRAEDARAARDALSGAGIEARPLAAEESASDFKSDGSIQDTVQDMFLSLTGEEGAQSDMEALYRAAIEQGNQMLAVPLAEEARREHAEELLRRHSATQVLVRPPTAAPAGPATRASHPPESR